MQWFIGIKGTLACRRVVQIPMKADQRISWGHTVVSSYITTLEDWSANQDKIDGYINYKGSHEQEMGYVIARPRMLEHAEQQIINNLDVQYWQEVRDFYQERTTLTTASDFGQHDEYAFRVMGSSISVLDRVWSGIKASIFSAFNGIRVFPNNMRTNQAEDFMSSIASGTGLREFIHRIHVPTLLVYGRKDLMSPVEVGEFIYNEIDTDEIEKELLVLERSRHGAENGDIEILQRAVIEFIEKYR